jgi:hypothetical protein
MEQLTEKYEQLMEKYIKLKMEHENLIQVKKKNVNKNHNIKKQINENPSFFERCNGRTCIFFCCFEENTIIKVLENNKEISKPISDIKLNDLVLTYEHGNKKYTKVNFFKKYEDDFEFYEIKAKLGDKVKTIVVTGNHIMICYDKNMSQARYMTAENVTKNDYFYTVDGLYQIYEINIKTKKNKYSLGVEEGAIMASDILVTCFNYNEVNRKLSIDELLSSYKLKNFIN